MWEEANLIESEKGNNDILDFTYERVVNLLIKAAIFWEDNRDSDNNLCKPKEVERHA
jgi:hypothetical protein